MTNYRDVHNREGAVDTYLKRLQKTTMSQKQQGDIKDFVSLLRIGKIGSKVRERRISSYIQFLYRLHEYFDKDLEKLTEKECEKFYTDLSENKILKKNNTPYSESSKDEFVKTLKRFLGWKWGRDSSKYRKNIKWMKEGKPKSSKIAITKEQCEAMIKYTLKGSNPERNSCLIMLLFDSGARIEEALNLTFEDITPTENDCYMVHIRGEKTELADRNIVIPLCTTLLNKWIEKHPTQEGYLFPLQYDNARKIIRQVSKKSIKITLRPHEFRHSSATYYIQHGGFGADNIGGFYYRYGWKFGSKEAERYIKQYMYGGTTGQAKTSSYIITDKVDDMRKEMEEKLREKDEQIYELQQMLIQIRDEIRKNNIKVIS